VITDSSNGTDPSARTVSKRSQRKRVIARRSSEFAVSSRESYFCRGTTGFSECEQLTQRKSKRPIEHFVAIHGSSIIRRCLDVCQANWNRQFRDRIEQIWMD
jgi:hypothetical protein